jgi:hypothetical protein
MAATCDWAIGYLVLARKERGTHGVRRHTKASSVVLILFCRDAAHS